MNLSCLITDDEDIAARGVEKFALQIPFLGPVRLCNSAMEALQAMTENRVDLLFLDIAMPKISGLQFLRGLSHPPMVVITTAYTEHALEGYELEVMDYLVKPFSFERFLKACNKCREYHELKKQPKHGRDDYFFIKVGNQIEKIEIGQILFIEALENYVNIYTSTRKYLTLVGLSQIEAFLKDADFLKVQRSYIIARAAIGSIDGNTICIGPHRIPISRKWKDEVLADILANKLLKR